VRIKKPKKLKKIWKEKTEKRNVRQKRKGNRTKNIRKEKKNRKEENRSLKKKREKPRAGRVPLSARGRTRAAERSLVFSAGLPQDMVLVALDKADSDSRRQAVHVVGRCMRGYC
jgi:predicted AAA+ superfamily ATPase